MDKVAYPGFAWESLDDPEFRISFAQLWAQWLRSNAHDERAVRAIRIYVEPFLSSSDIGRQASAVNFLGAVGEASDLPMLEKLAIEGARPVALNAVEAIERIGGIPANAALKAIHEKAKDPVIRDRASKAAK